MKSSPTLRVLMAAGLYLLLMWGYVVLQTPQFYAVYAAAIMCIALLFWVSESRVHAISAPAPITPVADNDVQPSDASDLSVYASNEKIDFLKADLMEQYAQFGRDQSALNCKGLGTWHNKDGNRGRNQ